MFKKLNISNFNTKKVSYFKQNYLSDITLVYLLGLYGLNRCCNKKSQSKEGDIMPKIKPNEMLDTKEVLEIIDKQWANTNDIMKLGYVGYTKARNISNSIKDSLVEKGYYLPRGLVPMKEVVKFLNIDIGYLKKIKN